MLCESARRIVIGIEVDDPLRDAKQRREDSSDVHALAFAIYDDTARIEDVRDAALAEEMSDALVLLVDKIGQVARRKASLQFVGQLWEHPRRAVCDDNAWAIGREVAEDRQ